MKKLMRKDIAMCRLIINSRWIFINSNFPLATRPSAVFWQKKPAHSWTSDWKMKVSGPKAMSKLLIPMESRIALIIRPIARKLTFRPEGMRPARPQQFWNCWVSWNCTNSRLSAMELCLTNADELFEKIKFIQAQKSGKRLACLFA